MLRLKEYCERVRDDAYGGSLELVEDGIVAIVNELESASFAGRDAAAAILEGYADGVLAVSSGILPLINMLDAVMLFAERIETQRLAEQEIKDAFREHMRTMRSEQDTRTEKIGRIGANMIEDQSRVGTFSTSGTIMSIFEQAVAAGKSLEAVAFEARPHSEGYRTLEEISHLGIPVTFGVDALMCCLIPGCDSFFIGVDAITSTGSVFAKTGSYCAALVCREFGIPFYVAADTGKLDRLSLLGYPLKDSSRPYREVADIEVPAISQIKNISFELIPPHLIRGIITENGIIPPSAVSYLMAPEKMSARMAGKLEKWLLSSTKH